MAKCDKIVQKREKFFFTHKGYDHFVYNKHTFIANKSGEK